MSQGYSISERDDLELSDDKTIIRSQSPKFKKRGFGKVAKSCIISHSCMIPKTAPLPKEKDMIDDETRQLL